MIGNTSPTTERTYATLLAPYLSDPTSIFIISSDFCHWGSRFNYTYYLPSTTTNVGQGIDLRKSDAPQDPPIFESIERLDRSAMGAVESGSHDGFWNDLRLTKNTVCGRHPIGVIMAAIEEVNKGTDGNGNGDGDGSFKFVRYEQSSEVEDASDSSVSYASAFAVL